MSGSSASHLCPHLLESERIFKTFLTCISLPVFLYTSINSRRHFSAVEVTLTLSKSKLQTAKSANIGKTRTSFPNG